ncbi:MAG: alpha-glucosidase C-terminal domain-containing protein [Marmoricola sp.]
MQLDLRRWEGITPIELLGGVRFPEVGELPYLLTLGGYGFYWIRLPVSTPLQTQMAKEQCHECHSPPHEPGAASRLSEPCPWFGGKGREFEVKEQRSVPLTESTWIELIEVSYPTGDQECFQLPLVAYDWPQDRLSHALIEFVDGHAIYDAVHDREAMAVWLKGFAQRTRNGGLEFHLIGEPDLDLTAHSTLFQGEQSNSSVTFGESSQLKVFRKVTPGVNPDVEILEALTTADCPHIAALYGWVSLRDGDDTIHLAILQNSSVRPPKAGRSPWPVSVTCWQKATCTQTKWAATSPERPTGSACPSARFTSRCATKWANGPPTALVWPHQCLLDLTRRSPHNR